jgi:hypothetical protein
MFEDQKVELLPEKTTMVTISAFNQNYDNAIVVAANVAHVNLAGNQQNVAAAAAAAGSNFGG